MRSIPVQFQKIATRVLVPALLLWFGSVSFLNCCAQDFRASAQDRDIVNQVSISAIEEEEATHCYAERGHCCSAQMQETAAVVSENPCNAHRQSSGRMPCCSPAGQAADRARKSRVGPEERADLQSLKTASGALESSARSIPYELTTEADDRSGTYLRDCVFLI